MASFYQDLMLCAQETACSFVFKQPSTSEELQACLVNPPCGCATPGKDLKCEECPHLEACLSHYQTPKLSSRYSNRSILTR